jgi:signal transduction histidine kinase
LVLGFISLGLVWIIYRVFGRIWRKRRFGDSIDHSLLMVEYGRKMTSAQDQAALGDLLVEEFPCALETQRAALLLTEGHHLVPGDQEDLRLPINHSAVRWVASGGEAQRADRGKLRELVPTNPTNLIWTRVWVPLMRGSELQGLWLLGRRESHKEYSPADLRWLTALGRQAATVLETTRYAEQERRAASEIRALYRQVVKARETERGRIARELHDGILQDLCAVTRDLRALEAQIEGNGILFAGLAARSGRTVTALRAICSDLRPPLLQHDLLSALRALVEELDARSPAPIHIEISTQRLSLSNDTALAIFRITQEALHNAIQHADASEIAVRLTQYPDRLRLTVTDDGQGIVRDIEPGRFVSQGHFGLAGMRERAAMIGGRLSVQTAPEYGTVVILELPQAGEAT